MIPKQEPAAWPFVVALVLLFTWCVTAPRQWQRSVCANEARVAIARRAVVDNSDVRRATSPATTLPSVGFQSTDPLAAALPIKNARLVHDEKPSDESNLPSAPETKTDAPALTPMSASVEP